MPLAVVSCGVQSAPRLLSVFQTSHQSPVLVLSNQCAAGPLLMRCIIEKRCSHARFQRLTSTRFVGASGVSVCVKPGIGSAVPFRTPDRSSFGKDKTTRVFEYQSRWFSGLVPSNLERFLVMDVTASMGSSMSVLDLSLIHI